MGDSRWEHLQTDNAGNCVPAKWVCGEGRTRQGIEGTQRRRMGLLAESKVPRGTSWQRDVSGHGRFPREALESHGEQVRGTRSGMQDSQEQGGGRECGHFQAQQPLVASGFLSEQLYHYFRLERPNSFFSGPSSEIFHFTE